MKTYKIYHSARFDKELEKRNKDFCERVNKIENHGERVSQVSDIEKNDL